MIYDNIILRIQKNLEEYRKIVEVLQKEKIEDFSVVALKGNSVCESMLEFILINKGIKVENGMVITEQNNSCQGPRVPQKRASIISYCTVVDKTIVPSECLNFLNLIRNYRNQAAHVAGLNREMIVEFSRALDYFTAWFSKQHISAALTGEEFEKIKSRFFSLENILCQEEEVTHSRTDSELIEKLLTKINEQTDIIVNLSKQVNRIDERSERIENIVIEIDRQLKELTNQINAYQSLVERQIEKAESDDEIDRIIQGYADECVERIVKVTNANAEKRTLEIEKRKLITSLGESAWNKLDETSKTFLISSKLMYNHLILVDDETDYSGVCVLVTKALEVEMSKRFYSRFLDYLDDVYKKDYSQYHTALLFQGSKPLKPEKFTMGSIAYAMCYFEDKFDSNSKKKRNKERLIEYAKAKLFPQNVESEIISMIHEYAEAIEEIRTKYRNPSAHTDELHQVDAEKCFNLVLDVEKLLKTMLDSFAE